MLKTIQGMKDILPGEIELWQKVENITREHFKLFGYSEIRTPLLESTDLFVRGIGSETGVVKKEMYTFDDKSGDSVTLRPEGTASVVRSYVEHRLDNLDSTTKVYYIGPMFRHERPQKGRLRQFHQMGAELIGPASPLADVEVILMLSQLIEKFGIADYSLQVNSLGCATCRPPFQQSLKQYLNDRVEQLCADCKGRIERGNPLRVFDCKNPICIEQLKEAPTILEALCGDCKNHFTMVEGGLKSNNVNFIINPRIARGLDYYQRTAFELTSNKLGSQSAFAGGGRYDGLIKSLEGPEKSAIGFAIGMERLLMLLPETFKGVVSSKIYIAFMGGTGHCKAVGIARSLRDAGLTCEIEYEEKSLKSQLRRADKLGFDHIIILGDDEVAKGVAQVKDFKAKTQEEVSLDQLVNYFKSKQLCE